MNVKEIIADYLAVTSDFGNTISFLNPKTKQILMDNYRPTIYVIEELDDIFSKNIPFIISSWNLSDFYIVRYDDNGIMYLQHKEKSKYLPFLDEIYFSSYDIVLCDYELKQLKVDELINMV